MTESYDKYCNEYEKWIVEIHCDKSIIYTVWGTDKTDDDKDKFILNDDNKIIASKSINTLINHIENQSLFFDADRSKAWISVSKGSFKSDYKFKLDNYVGYLSLESFNIRSMVEIVDFINLFGDLAYQIGSEKLIKLTKCSSATKLYLVN